MENKIVQDSGEDAKKMNMREINYFFGAGDSWSCLVFVSDFLTWIVKGGGVGTLKFGKLKRCSFHYDNDMTKKPSSAQPNCLQIDKLINLH